MNKNQILKRMKEIAEEIIKDGADVKALENEANELRSKLEKLEKRQKILDELEQQEEENEDKEGSEGLEGEETGEAEQTEARKIKKPDGKRNFAEPKQHKRLRLFRNFGEQLAAIKAGAQNGTIDERQQKLQNESRSILGMNTTIGSEGGLAIQTDFAGMMMESAATQGNILPLVDRYDVSGNSNAVNWVDIDETSVATTVFGGVQVYWAGEASSVTAKTPKLVERELKLLKLMGTAYATHEMESNSSFVSDLYQRAFQTAINRELEACILTGTGAGKPLGIINGPAAVSVAKETGQAAATIVWENVGKIYNRALSKVNGVWVIHPDCNTELDNLVLPIGVGGVPVTLSAAQGGTVTNLKGRPIVESDHCSALGTVGDINFVDFSQYMMIFKGGLQQDYSIHVQFLTAQNCFRFIFYANGMPKQSSALTIKNSSNTRSACVKLATRS